MITQKFSHSFYWLLLLLFAVGGPGIAQAACLTGATPIGYWQLEEATANPNTFTDASSTANNGACTGNCPGQADGQVGFGQTFVNTDEVISIPSNAAYNFASDSSFAFEVWILRSSATSVTTNEVIIERRHGTASWWVGLNTNARATFSLRDSASTSYSISGSATMADDTWHHIAAVRDGSTGMNLLYVDGVLEASSEATYSGAFPSANSITVGDSSASGNYDFNGAIDEVAIYDNLLAAETVRQHFINGEQKSGYCEALAPLLVSSSTEAALGATVNWPIECAGNPIPNIFSIANAPSNMTIDASNGEISWMPYTTQLGLATFDVTAGNGVGSPDTQTLSIDVIDMCASDKMAGYWRLEEDTADPNTFIDSSATANNGDCSGNCPQQADGQLDFGQSFAGVDDAVTIPSNTAYDAAGGSFAIEVWMLRSTLPSGDEVIVSRRDAATSMAWSIALNSSGKAVFSLSGGTDTSATTITGTTNVANDTWHHIAAVRDGITEKDLLYVDGVLEASAKVTHTGTFASTAGITIGDDTAAGDLDFNGTIDEVAIYSRTLTDTMVLQHAMMTDNDYCYRPQQVNANPVITTIAPTTAKVGVAYTYDANATDPDTGDTLTWSLVSGPSGMNINASTGVVTWTPPSNASATTNYSIKVSDGKGGSATENVTLKVTSADSGNTGGSSGGGGGGGCFIDTVTTPSGSGLSWLFVFALLPITGIFRRIR